MILDEYAIAKDVLATQKIKRRQDLFIVAKYLRREMKCDELETFDILKTIASNSISNYDEIQSSKYLESVSSKAGSYELKQIEHIVVTNKELERIATVENAKLKRLLFTLLVYAKYNNALSENNNCWCNIKIGELYRVAKVSTRNAKEKALFLNKLREEGAISFSRQNTNLNIRCLFVDEENDVGILITDLRELGYQYINIYDSSQFVECELCGVLIKKNGKHDGSTRYCNSCKNTIRTEQKLNCFLKLDRGCTLASQ